MSKPTGVRRSGALEVDVPVVELPPVLPEDVDRMGPARPRDADLVAAVDLVDELPVVAGNPQATVRNLHRRPGRDPERDRLGRLLDDPAGLRTPDAAPMHVAPDGVAHAASSQPAGRSPPRHAGSGSQVAHASLHQRSPACELGRDSSAFTSDRRDLGLGPPTQPHPFVEALLVLEVPGAVRLDDDVELVILRVDPERRAPEGRLQVHVPEGETPLRPGPEQPDGMSLARALQLEHAVAAPTLLPVPGMEPARPVAVGIGKLRSLGDEQREQVVGVLHDDRRLTEPGPAETELAADDLLARLPAVRSLPQCPIQAFPSSSRS